MEVVLQLRGTNQASVKDLVDLRKYVVQQNLKTQIQMISIEQKLNPQGERKSASSRPGSISNSSTLKDTHPSGRLVLPTPKLASTSRAMNRCMLEQILINGQDELSRYMKSREPGASEECWKPLDQDEAASMNELHEALTAALDMLERNRSRCKLAKETSDGQCRSVALE